MKRKNANTVHKTVLLRSKRCDHWERVWKTNGQLRAMFCAMFGEG